jgi:hypothetical protein
MVLYEYQNSRQTIRDEHRQLRRIFGPMRDEVTGEWRELHNEGLHNFYTPTGITRVIGGKVVSPTHRPHSTPQKYYFYVSGTHFC